MENSGRFLEIERGSAFLLGPRGTGKTRWCHAEFPDAIVFDLLRPELALELSSHPEKLRELLLGQPGKRVVVIDEVQKVPALLDVVHDLMERDRRTRFILTGSSSRKLKRAGVNLLAGRAVQKFMHPFMAAELGKRFNFARALRTGLLPLAYFADDPQATLRTYQALYLREEVFQEAMVRNFGDFTRFIEALSFSHGSQINLSDVAREGNVTRKSAEGYLSVLEDLLLAFRLEVFTRRAKRALSGHPKFYFFDCGVFRTARPVGPLDSSAEIEGAALEGLVAQHLRAWNDYGGRDHQLFFWRTPSGTEVDFVIYGPSGLFAIEVKRSTKVRPQDLAGLKAFGEDYPSAQATLLYSGTERFVRDNVLCQPVEPFLRALNPGQGLPL